MFIHRPNLDVRIWMFYLYSLCLRSQLFFSKFLVPPKKFLDDVDKALVPLRGSQKSKVKSQKADSVGFSLLLNGNFISAVVY
jgi:hypothetical protein